MNRVEEIDIAIIPGRLLEKNFRDLPMSAPQLHIRIHCVLEVGRPTSPKLFFRSMKISSTTQNACNVFNCKIGWDSRLLTGLTRLNLEAEDSLNLNSSINQFLHALQRMPALTELHLKDSIPDDSEATYPVVGLPCLRILSISSGVGALTAVLRHITFPHTSSAVSSYLTQACKENQSTQINLSLFLSVFATKLLSSLVFRSLCSQLLEGTQTQGLEFYLWTIAIDRDYFPLILSSSSLIPLPQLLLLVLTWPSLQPHDYVKALTCAFDATGMSLSFLT